MGKWVKVFLAIGILFVVCLVCVAAFVWQQPGLSIKSSHPSYQVNFSSDFKLTDLELDTQPSAVVVEVTDQETTQTLSYQDSIDGLTAYVGYQTQIEENCQNLIIYHRCVPTKKIVLFINSSAVEKLNKNNDWLRGELEYLFIAGLISPSTSITGKSFEQASTDQKNIYNDAKTVYKKFLDTYNKKIFEI